MAACFTWGSAHPTAGNRVALRALFAGFVLIAASRFALPCAASQKPVTLLGDQVICRPRKGNSDSWIALVHGSQTEFLFRCEGGLPVPSGLVTEAREFCTVGLAAAPCERLKQKADKFVPGAVESWFSGDDLETGVKFTVPEEKYPSVYKGFRIGCVHGKYSCMVSVHIQAREPEVQGQVARCSYPHNVRTPRLSLTPQNNSITVICGDEGALVPFRFATEYCEDSDEYGGCTRKKFSDIFPDFSENWWDENASNRGATLTIPQRSFPQTASRFNVVCRTVVPDGKHGRHDCVVGVDVSPGNLRRVGPGDDAGNSTASVDGEPQDTDQNPETIPGERGDADQSSGTIPEGPGSVPGEREPTSPDTHGSEQTLPDSEGSELPLPDTEGSDQTSPGTEGSEQTLPGAEESDQDSRGPGSPGRQRIAPGPGGSEESAPGSGETETGPEDGAGEGEPGLERIEPGWGRDRPRGPRFDPDTLRLNPDESRNRILFPGGRQGGPVAPEGQNTEGQQNGQTPSGGEGGNNIEEKPQSGGSYGPSTRGSLAVLVSVTGVAVASLLA